jgi:hypothetical protein
MEKTKLKTIDIRGKKYSTVDSRVEFFREKFPAWSLETEYPVLDLDKGVCVCRAVVKDETGKVVADGYAHEWVSKPGSTVNKTSYVENAQTSAVGRALGFIGIGINGMGIATAEEVKTAIDHQENNDFAPIEEQVGDSIPYAHPDDWITVNAFEGMMQRCNDITEISNILNGQKGNPNLDKLVPLATARKQEILATMGA